MSPEAHQVWLGRSGVGDGSQDPPLCGSAAGRLVLQLVSLGTRAGPEVSGIWVQLIGHPLHHRGPSPSWDSWAVILKGPSRRSSESTRARYGILGDIVHLHPQAGSMQWCSGLVAPCPATAEARPSQAAWPELCSSSAGDDACWHGCPGDTGNDEGSRSTSGHQLVGELL